MPSTCRGRACPEVMGDREGAVLSDKHGVVVRETSRRALQEGNPQDFPFVSHDHLPHLAARQERVCRKELWSGQEGDFIPITPHHSTC